MTFMRTQRNELSNFMEAVSTITGAHKQQQPHQSVLVWPNALQLFTFHYIYEESLYAVKNSFQSNETKCAQRRPLS